MSSGAPSSPGPSTSRVRVWRIESKVAVTSLAADIVTWHFPSPSTEPQPVQVTALEWAPGVPVRVTGVPSSYCSSQSRPQLIPEGELVTVPVPVPAFLTLSRNLGLAPPENSAFTDLASDIVTSQEPV